MLKEKNPVSEQDKKAFRVEPELETDDFGPEEQKKIVRMVMQDADNDYLTRKDWLADRKKDLEIYEGEKPSKIENLKKKEWMSDRNLRLATAIADSYQATLLATVYNPDMIHFVSTGVNDIDRKQNLEKFTKVIVKKQECNLFPEVDDFVHNRVVLGTSFFKIYWQTWFEWIDRRIPKTNKEGKFTGYRIKTEKIRRERGRMINISDIDDILVPNFGSKVQDLNHIILILHLTGEDLLDYGKRNIFTNINEETIQKLKQACYNWYGKTLGAEKARQLGIREVNDITDVDLRVFPIDIYEWYGTYEKNGMQEKYRMHVEPTLNLFCAGKPLRKVTRSGRVPIVGGALRRVPGQILGQSLMNLVAGVTNAFNNVFNQKADFQYFENCPGGWFKPDETYKKQKFVREPGVYYPTDDPSSVVESSKGGTMSWAMQDFELLLEVTERLTGAAAYFMSNTQGVSGTATRDRFINEKSETRFGLWVRRLIDDVSEGLTMLVGMYQDWAPPGLGERILDEEGKKLFPNLSIETLQGDYGAYLVPDIISGSKTLEKEIAGLAYMTFKDSIWFHPQLNPRGAWKLLVNAAKKMGLTDIESFMIPEPQSPLGMSKEVDAEWAQFKQGDVFDPPEGATQQAIEHYMGHVQQKSEKYHELDEEYRMNFDAHLFATFINVQKFMADVQKQQMADSLAQRIVQNKETGISDAVER